MLFRVVLYLFFLINISCDIKSDELKISQNDSLATFISSFEEYTYDESHTSDYIYDQDKLHRFDIYLSDENLNRIDNDPAAEEYVEGFLVFE